MRRTKWQQGPIGIAHFRGYGTGAGYALEDSSRVQRLNAGVSKGVTNCSRFEGAGAGVDDA